MNECNKQRNNDGGTKTSDTVVQLKIFPENARHMSDWNEVDFPLIRITKKYKEEININLE